MVEILDIVVGGAGGEGADFESCGEKDGCFQAYHLHVFGNGDVVACFEVHVILLAFAYLHAGLFECLEDGQQVRVLFFDEVAPGEYVHGVARKNGDIVVPFAVDGRLSAAYGRTVHKVVVEEGEVVERFDADGIVGRHVDVPAEEVGGCEEQERADTFAT